MSNAVIRHRDRPQPAVAQRRRPVELADRERMIAASLEGRSVGDIAKELGRSEHTVRNVLRSPEAVARKEQLAQDIRDVVRLKLLRAADRAVDSWMKQLDHADAGTKAQHLPARDLLTHTGVLDIPSPKKDDKPQVTIIIGGSSDDIEPILVEAEELELAQLQARVDPELPDDDPTA